MSSWIDACVVANEEFTRNVNPSALPQRGPGTRAVITCMDPRVNLEAIGIPAYGSDGSQGSQVRIIRTLGGRAEERSLLVGIFLAGIREFLVLAHTDCGCALAHTNAELIVDRMNQDLEPASLEGFQDEIGSTADDLRRWLKTFADPGRAVVEEIAAIKALPFVPDDVVIHGMVYHVETGAIEVVVDGSER